MRRTALVALAMTVATTTPALGSGAFSVTQGPTPAVQAGDVSTWFSGMFSPVGNPRGHVTGAMMGDGASSLDLIFGSGARIVAYNRPGAEGGTWRRRIILGGTGRYLGATGVVRTSRVRGVLTHDLRYSLPRRGTPRLTMAYVVKLGTPRIINRGGPGGVGNARLITGSILDSARATVGTYGVDSTLAFVYGAGTYEWYTGTFSYEFADGTLTAAGPYQRASASAPGALGASGRVVSSGTGAYSGMRGQVVVAANPDGTATHSFTLIRR